jgi:hypothetical protein
MKVRILPRDDEDREQALRIITRNGPVRYMAKKNEFGIPDCILPLLYKQSISYEVISRKNWMTV